MNRARRRGGFGSLALIALVAGLALALLPAAGNAAKGSLPRVPGPDPGPGVLYAKSTTAPQLRNAGPWEAKPLLVSGASAYRRGEFLYQDFLYDDHGARAASRDPNDPRSGDDTFSAPNGTYTYPSAPAYDDNAADLVELRVKPLRRATAFRLTMNTMHRPGLAATTIAIGNSKRPRALPHGANATAPARLFMTVHGRKADLRRAKSGKRVGPAPKVKVSEKRKQITVRLAHRSWNPRRRSVRLAAGTGLWDRAAKAYKIPAESRTESEPGGAAGLPDPTAIFNLAFRHQEPLPDLSEASGTGAVANPAWWRDKAQAAALRENSLKPFSARVDFAKLRRGANDPLRGKPAGIPTSGPINRIMSTRFASKQTTRFPDPSCGQPTDCVGQYRGRLQPYVVNPTMDFPRLGTVGDHAYWLSGLRLRDGSGQAPLGRVEAFSQGFGRGVPVAEPTEARNGTLEGGNIGPLNFTETSRAWGPSEPQPKRNRLSLELENIGRLVVATKRARLNCNARLDVTSDGPVTVRLAGCPGSQSFPASP